jgi:hypothetical protein
MLQGYNQTGSGVGLKHDLAWICGHLFAMCRKVKHQLQVDSMAKKTMGISNYHLLKSDLNDSILD